MSEREWQFYVGDMIGFADRVLAYTQEFDQQRFIASGINYDAVLRNLELIGEAATHIPQAVREANPSVPWRLIIATRNRLVHGTLASTMTHCGASFVTSCRRCCRHYERCWRSRVDR